jgi:hypothetical protein
MHLFILRYSPQDVSPIHLSFPKPEVQAFPISYRLLSLCKAFRKDSLVVPRLGLGKT